MAEILRRPNTSSSGPIHHEDTKHTKRHAQRTLSLFMPFAMNLSAEPRIHWTIRTEEICFGASDKRGLFAVKSCASK